VSRFYFDHNATTPVSNEVLEVLVPALADTYGNASSIHQNGQAAKQALERARRQVAGFLHCPPKDLVFTAGGTEADNLAILGAVRASCHARPHAITTAIEHPAVLKACAQMEREGTEVTRVPLGASGVVDPDDVLRAMRPETVLISVMHANNETGTIQPVREIAKAAREAGVLFHSDGVQAAGKTPVDTVELDVDLYAISGHKLYAPKGIGALYIRKGVSLAPVAFGGNQERGLKPGTENVPGAAALGCAADWLRENQEELQSGLRQLRDRLETAVTRRIGGAHVNCAGSPRVPNTSSIRFDGVNGEPLLIALDMRGFAVSSGSACSSGAVEPSYVLTAIGLSRAEARSSLRFSLGRGNTAAQVDALVDALAESVAKLRKVAPVHA
jgi:cysteine desulfurase